MKVNKFMLLFVLTVFGVFLILPIVTLQAEEAVLTAAGCPTEYFLLTDLAEAYKANTGQSLQIGKTGNKKAVILHLEQKIDFTFTCKPIQKLTKGLKLDPNAVSSWSSVAIAKDPIVVVSNAGNGVDNVTSEQLTKLFQGDIANGNERG